jgi:hypothetical protein
MRQLTDIVTCMHRDAQGHRDTVTGGHRGCTGPHRDAQGHMDAVTTGGHRG